VGSAGASKVMKPGNSKVHERLHNAGDESREGVRGQFAEGKSFNDFHEAVMEYFSSMLH